MKKLCVLFLLLSALVLQFCSSSKNAAVTNVPKTTFAGNVQPILASRCTPCHFPPKGRMKAFDNYTAAKADIDSILDRVNRNPGDKGFMPFKHPKLTDSTINVLAQWKKDGLLENL